MSTWDASELAEAYWLLGPENMNLLNGVCTEHSGGELYYGSQLVMADGKILSIDRARQYARDGDLTPADAFTDYVAEELKDASHFVAGCFSEGQRTLFVYGLLKK